MNLPSFLWLWRIAAWSMGLTIFTYFLLAISGFWLRRQRIFQKLQPNFLRLFHFSAGICLVILVLLLLGIGIIGTLGHYGSLGHSWHLGAGFLVVTLVLASATSAFLISRGLPQMRTIHVSINLTLLLGLIWVLVTGWDVVQKYLP
jgi:hypothetical protein